MYLSNLSVRTAFINFLIRLKWIAIKTWTIFIYLVKTTDVSGKIQKAKKFNNIPSNPHALLDYMQEHGFWYAIKLIYPIL